MAGWLSTGQLRRMRRDWDQRARENARHYVVTGRQEWSDEEFYRSGEIAMEEDILNDLGNICQGMDPRRMKVLEIGCGAGRMTRALAAFFGEVYAVDISPEMVRQARKIVSDVPTAHVIRNNGKDLSAIRPRWHDWLRWGPRLEFDFAFSSMVFQHIPSREIIQNYVREVHRLLRPGALFKFQVQGCPQVDSQPESTWIGVPITEEQAGTMARTCGFELRYQAGVGHQYYWLWYFKSHDSK